MNDAGESPLGDSSVVAMLETKSGCLAVGTLDQGLFLIFPGRGVVHYNRANGFPDNWVRALCEDQEGTLWVGTGSSGLVALRPSRVTTFKAPDDWQGASVLSITHSHDGAIWAATEGSGVYRFYDNQWTHFTASQWHFRFVRCGRFRKITKSSMGGTWGQGLFIKNGNHFDSILTNEPTIAATAVLHGRNGVTWIGTTTGLLRYKDGKVTHYGEKEGLALPDIRALAEVPDGTLWFGMLGGGLGRLQNGEIKQFRKPTAFRAILSSACIWIPMVRCG